LCMVYLGCFFVHYPLHYHIPTLSRWKLLAGAKIAGW
jgi:hypothetical protein